MSMGRGREEELECGKIIKIKGFPAQKQSEIIPGSCF
jgi:hypothetical protein